MTQFHSSEPYWEYRPPYYTWMPQESWTRPPEKSPVYIVIIPPYDKPDWRITRNWDGSFKITC